jgi:hypothetical protein
MLRVCIWLCLRDLRRQKDQQHVQHVHIVGYRWAQTSRSAFLVVDVVVKWQLAIGLPVMLREFL